MRPKPLIPTRTVMIRISFGFSRSHGRGQSHLNELRSGAAGPLGLVCVDLPESAALLLVEHLSADICLGVGYTQLRCPLISSSEQSSNPSRHRVLRQGRFMHLTKLLQTGLLVLDAEQAGRPKMV